MGRHDTIGVGLQMHRTLVELVCRWKNIVGVVLWVNTTFCGVELWVETTSLE